MRPNWYCAVVLFGGAVLQPCIAQAADPQPYRVQLQSTGNGALDSTLKATSQLVALRVSVPVDPFGLIARARGDLDRLNTVLQSFGYYQSAVSIAIEGLALDTPTLSDTLSALPRGKDAVCKISFSLGPLYHLGRIEIEGSAPDFARRSLGLASGAPAVAADAREPRLCLRQGGCARGLRGTGHASVEFELSRRDGV